MVQGESGTDSKGYGNDIVKKTRLFRNSEILQQLPVLNGMAELSKNQVRVSGIFGNGKTNQKAITKKKPTKKLFKAFEY